MALVVLVTAGCARVSVDAAPAAPALLAAVTWNMNAGKGDLPRLVADLESGRLVRTRAREYLILLQEAIQEDAPVVRALADARGWSVMYVPVRHDGRVTRGNAILSSRPLLNPRAVPLPVERQPRAAAVATIDIAGERLFVVSAHLENRVSWRRGLLFSDAARARQAEALIAALPLEMPGILGGDLNTWLGPNERALRLLARRFADTPGGPMKPTLRDRLSLDHLLFDLPSGWRASAEVVPDTYGSDHNPVLAVVTDGVGTY